MNIFFIYVTCPSLQVAQSISQSLLERHLIGCANIFPVTAKYRWEGEIIEENEVMLILKATPQFADIVADEVIKIHPYQVPCIAKIPVDVNDVFGQWIKKECKS